MARKKENKVFKYIERHRRSADAPYEAGAATLGIFAVVSMVLFGASWFQYIALSTNNFAAVVSAVLVDLANSDRAESGVHTLLVNKELTDAAQAKANDMALRGYFSHNGPDGKEPWAWIKEAGYGYQFAGENLAIQFSDSIEVERAWLDSELHRKNILDARFTEVGIATSYGVYHGAETTFVVQMFGAPKAVAPTHTEVKSKGNSQKVVIKPRKQESVLGATYAPPEIKSSGTQATFIEHIAASPQTYLHYGYGILTALILMLGVYIFSYEIRQRHIKHSAYALLLCSALLFVLYIADATLFTDVIVAVK